MSKYGAKRTWDDDAQRWFDSKAEWIRYRQLLLLERAGTIVGLVCQPKFELFAKKGDLRAIVYIADFGYAERGVSVVEDVKGYATGVWKLKWAIAQRVYPHIEWRVVQAKEMYRG